MTAASTTHAPYDVFIVEDHAGMRRALRRLLERAGELKVAGEAASAEAALEALRDESPDLLVVDLNLPGMSGIDLIARVRQAHPDVRCIVVSAYAEAERRRAAMDAGALGFVSKDEPHKIVPALIEVGNRNGRS